MIQVVVDDALRRRTVLEPIQQWTTACFARDLRPREIVLDERIPVLLRELKQPTFVTIDDWFWQQRLCSAHYCIVYFALRADEQDEIPALLLRLFRLRAFKTQAARMGKVAQVSRRDVRYYQLSDDQLHLLPFPKQRRRRRKR